MKNTIKNNGYILGLYAICAVSSVAYIVIGG